MMSGSYTNLEQRLRASREDVSREELRVSEELKEGQHGQKPGMRGVRCKMRSERQA